MKALYLVVLFMGFYFLSNAQKQVSYISVGPSVGIPINFTNCKIGSGIGFRYYKGVSRQGSIMGNINAMIFPLKVAGDVSFFSTKVGYQSVIKHSNLFVYGDAGIVYRSGFSRFKLVGGGDIYGAAGGGIGYSIPVNGKKRFDVIPSYNVAIQRFKDWGWVDVMVAYRFGG